MSPTVERIQALIKQNNDIPTHIFMKLGIPKNALSVWKKGAANPSVDALLKISNHYNVTLDYLVKGIDTNDLDVCNEKTYCTDTSINTSQENLDSVIERILELVDKSGLKDKEILKKMDISNSSMISDWRTGRSKSPTIQNIVKFASFFNVSTDYLLTGQKKYDYLSQKELEWLELYKQLSLADESVRNECIGFVKGYIKGTQTTK